MSDMTKPAKLAVLDLVNNDNNLSLSSGTVTFGLPTVNTGPGNNTTITVTAIPGAGYKNSKQVKYNRLDLAAILTASTKDATFPVGDNTKIADMIPAVNALLNINLGVDDFEDGDLPDFVGGIPNETLVVQLVAKADSLAYIGSLQFNLKSEEIDLAAVITVTELNGLTYVPVV